MVKGRSSSSPSQRPCPPLASLSLASTHLKPSSRPSPLSSLLKRTPPFSHTEELPMTSPPSPPPTSFYTPSHEESCLKSNAVAATGALMPPSRRCSSKVMKPPSPPDEGDNDDDKPDTQVFTCGRQRLQQHRIQVSGNVIIPDTWGSEQQLQEWVSYGIVEDALRPAGLMSARMALVSECQHRGGKSIRTSPAAISADVEVS